MFGRLEFFYYLCTTIKTIRNMKIKNAELTFEELACGIDTIFSFSNFMFLKLRENDKKTLLDKKYADGAFADKAASILTNGGQLVIINTYEIDDDSTEKDIADNTYMLTKGRIDNALPIVAEKYPKIMASIINGNDDYETWDVVFQVAMFGKVVYG